MFNLAVSKATKLTYFTVPFRMNPPLPSMETPPHLPPPLEAKMQVNAKGE